MASLPEQVHVALTNLLRGLQSPDNVERTAAEEQLNQEWFAQRPDVLLMGLSEQLDFAPDSPVRTGPLFAPQTRPLTLVPRADAHVRRCALQAPILETSQRALGPDPGRLPHHRPARAREHPCKIAAMLGQGGGTLG